MPTKVIMPQLGESVVEGTITKWLKGPGEPIKEMEPLVEVNTDKVDTEIPSPASGVLLDILIPEGTVVQAGTVLALVGQAGEQVAAPAGGGKTAAKAAPPAPRPEPAKQDAGSPSQGSSNGGQNAAGSSSFISPVVAKIAQEEQVDLSQVKGTGLSGRITKKDILAYVEQRKSTPAQLPAAAPAQATPARTPVRSAAPVPVMPGEDEILPLTPIRRQIAEHMVMSKHTSPHVTTVMEADLSRVVAHRKANKESFARDGINLTFTAYFVAAAVAALKAFPLVNSSWSEEGIRLHRAINIGMAASMGAEGLIVPVIKNADGYSLLGLARTINDLADRARNHKLQPDEVKGGTFTITNHGTSGSLFATPIINQPQCAILGVGAIQKRVVVAEGRDEEQPDAIAIRPMAYISLTFDHRILDGASGDHFLAKVVELLETWGKN